MVMEGPTLDESARDWEQFHRLLVVASVRTGSLMCPFDQMHAYIETLAGRPVWTHELANQTFADDLAKKAEPEFLALYKRIWPSALQGRGA